MKKILCLLLVLILLFSFAGCAPRVPEKNSSQESTSMFVKIETFRVSSGGGSYVFYHKDTKVMYIISYDGVATVMLNPDGTPQLYNK